MSEEKTKSTSAFEGLPQGEAFHKLVTRRERRGRIWLLIFRASLVISIVVLLALLYNILNQSFGLVAVRNSVEPTTLVRNIEESRMIGVAAETSEDDAALAEAIANDPNAIGFFGYAFFQERADVLRAVSVDGITPSIASVEAEEEGERYPLARPLFIYTAPQIVEDKPWVVDFLSYYLENVNSVIDEVGYFPFTSEEPRTNLETLQSAVAEDATSDDSSIVFAGSSTVAPLTQALVERYEADTGFGGEISIESIGTKAGFTALCLDKSADVANASRPYSRVEMDVCREENLEPVGLRVGTDAIAIVVSSQNSFLENASQEELRQIFTEAETWADVNGDWPAEPITRYIPSIDSGTLDFFAENIFDRNLVDLPAEALITIARENVRSNVIRVVETREAPLEELSQGRLFDLVSEYVVDPQVEDSWDLVESLFGRTAIEQEVAEEYQDATVEWRSWVNLSFLRRPQSSEPALAGIRIAILGSLWIIGITILFALPVGVGAAIYLEEYAAENALNRIIKTNIDNLAGVPSIIYGLLGLAIFVRGTAIPGWDGFDRSILAGGLTLGLLVLPLIIINAQEAIRAVPDSLRQAGYGLGATKWQVIWNHVLPNALPGILTGNILAMSRALGETAPLVVVGASTFITNNPSNVLSGFTVLPVQIYQWTARPQAEFQHIAAAAIVVLLVLLLTLNATAIILRNRFSMEQG